MIFLLALFTSLALHGGLILPTASQAQVTVTNQASAQFTSGGNVQTGTSNTTSYQVSGTAAQEQGLSIVKTADRAAAEPGDVVLYRLLVTNNSTTTAATPLTIVDQLPLGLLYVPDSVQATPTAPTSVSFDNSQITLEFPTLAAGESINIVYAVLLTPDSVRGSGENTAQASAPGFATVTSQFQLLIRPGIVADCGTVVGRVFVDKNFDGEQQPGEEGVPNAVVFMDDGNRIITDPEGLFSVANVYRGYRVGTLDLTSLPGYTLAPNLYRLDQNSQSRLVQLEPGGLVRMNFGVTPTFGEGQVVGPGQ
ncbi:MAG: hypothetical protein AAF215_03225 [Cyanobacteria bacterium P01_A01_bin.123]